MFEDVFIDRDTIARNRSAPLLEERLSYLKHCAHDLPAPVMGAAARLHRHRAPRL